MSEFVNCPLFLQECKRHWPKDGIVSATTSSAARKIHNRFCMDIKYMKGESAMALQARGLAAKQDDPSSNPKTCAGKTIDSRRVAH